MALVQHITKIPDVPVQVGVAESLAVAARFRNERIDQDNETFTRWLVGEISYDEVNDYFKSRFMGVVGEEQKAVKATKLKLEEQKQRIDDEFAYNRYLIGNLSFDDLRTYATGRMESKAPDSPGRDYFNRLLLSAEEIERRTEETLWADQFDKGVVSYDDYADFLKQRQVVYASGSPRSVEVQTKLNYIEPQYQIGQLEKLFAQGYWGNPKPDGTFDQFSNLIGYQNAMRDFMGRYKEGSPQQMEVFNLLNQIDSSVRMYQRSKDIQTAAKARNDRYLEFVETQSDYQKAIQNLQLGRATPEQVAQVEQRYSVAANNFNQAMTFLNELETSPETIAAKIPSAAPLPLSQIPSAIQQPAQAGQQAAQAAPALAAQQPQPQPLPAKVETGQAITTPAPALAPQLGKRVPAPELLKLLKEEDIVRQGADVYLKPGVTAPYKRLTLPELSKYKEKELIRLRESKDIYVRT